MNSKMSSTFELSKSSQESQKPELLLVDELRNSREDDLPNVPSWRQWNQSILNSLASPFVSQVLSSLAISNRIGNIEELKQSMVNLRESLAIKQPGDDLDAIYPDAKPTDSNEFLRRKVQARESLEDIRVSAKDIIEIATQGKTEIKEEIRVTDNLIAEVLSQMHVKPDSVRGLVEFIGLIKADIDQERTQRPPNYQNALLLQEKESKIAELQNDIAKCHAQMQSFMDVIFQTMGALKDINSKFNEEEKNSNKNYKRKQAELEEQVSVLKNAITKSERELIDTKKFLDAERLKNQEIIAGINSKKQENASQVLEKLNADNQELLKRIQSNNALLEQLSQQIREKDEKIEKIESEKAEILEVIGQVVEAAKNIMKNEQSNKRQNLMNFAEVMMSMESLTHSKE
ncbi:unnamed protein product [Blepharisma stoltei]|uniref:Uncharacterized protein n=1 Tax=Blepharisma stoltei TaxID=1481888 RepID=A0AAU9JXD0_9CILI|nr:unnamed protein product [Blepharisma stoltei]